MWHLLSYLSAVSVQMEEFDNACGQGIRPELADKALALKQYAKLKATFDQVISAVAWV